MPRYDDVLVERLCSERSTPADVASARPEDVREAVRRMHAGGDLTAVEIAKRVGSCHDSVLRWLAADRVTVRLLPPDLFPREPICTVCPSPTETRADDVQRWCPACSTVWELDGTLGRPGEVAA